MKQVELDFEGGLLDQFPEWNDMVKASVYGCGRQFKAIAADLDMSVSELSRKLNDTADVHFPLKRLPELIEVTGDNRLIYWLIEKFLEDKEAKQKRAIEEIASLLPKLQQLVKSAA